MFGTARMESVEEYKKNITQIVDQSQAAGIKVIILTTIIKPQAEE